MYAATQAIVNDLAKIYDNTDMATVSDATVRQNKYVSILSRVYYELWFRRDWRWTYASTDPLTMSSGSASLPTGFTSIGGHGGLYDSVGNPWRFIAYQDMESLRERSVAVNEKLFSIGPSTVLIPNTGSSEAFRFVYRTKPAAFSYVSNTTLAPMPVHFTMALLLGCAAAMKQEEGDPRMDLQLAYARALSNAMKAEGGMGAAQVLPMAIGGKW